LQETARVIVDHRHIVCNRFIHGLLLALSQPQITGEDLRHVLADEQLVEILQIEQAVQHEDALDQTIGMLHFADRLVVFLLAELIQAPVAQHARMEEVLVDGGEFVLELLIQVLNNGGIAFHGRTPRRVKATHSLPRQTWFWRPRRSTTANGDTRTASPKQWPLGRSGAATWRRGTKT